MASVANQPLVFNTERDGLALEKTSDKIDIVNVLMANIKNELSQAEKDKSQFRQYEAACDRVKSFYREQHEKQTVAYNLKARKPQSAECIQIQDPCGNDSLGSHGETEHTH